MIRQIPTVVSQARRGSGIADVFCATPMPPAPHPRPALTPALALAYVRELSADVRDGVVLGAGGDLLAGPHALHAPARALLVAAGEASELEVAAAEGVACAARGGEHAIVVACSRFAIPAVVREDLRAALAALAGGAPDAAAPPPAVPAEAVKQPLNSAAEALISACQRGIGA